MREWSQRRVLALGFLCATVLASATSVAQERGSTKPGRPIPFRKLNNGLVVLVEPDSRAPIAVFKLVVAAGSRNDAPGKSGTAGLLSRMIIYATQHVPVGGYRDILSRAGATQAEESVHSDRTTLSVVVPANRLALPLWLWSDQLGFFGPAATEASLARAKASLRSEWANKRLGSVASGLYAAALTSLYPESHPYHFPGLADPVRFEAVTLDDIRAFHQRWFVPNNAVLSVSGLVDPERVFALAEQYFGPIPSGPPLDRSAPAQPVLSGETRVEGVAPCATDEIEVLWPSPPYESPGDLELDVAAEVLSGNRVSWLSWQLVDKLRIARTISARQSSREWSSEFSVFATLVPGHTRDEALGAIDEVLHRLARDGPSEAELDKAKTELLIDEMFRYEKPSNRVYRRAHCQLRFNDPECLLRRFDALRRLKVDDVKRTLSRVLASGRIVLQVRATPGAPTPGTLTSKTSGSQP